ncbi:uncharacterized protein N7477_003555 [Penicillium maclennaniae]|uniref:uncharacterized protein n=1 Tax=Penicillium maclennaniae TaxID=1343394 RepID=UPI002540EA77|nr:uncharacterized protein N7477_003555 [Penicillium maclennaniae]KAJ5677922.1 hypothetical protein N7477_003555 [Penicillium maclennaniae]
MGPIDAELMLREQPAIEEAEIPSVSSLNNRVYEDRSISAEETKVIAQGILAIASDIKDKNFDKDIANKLLRGDHATLIGALVAGVNNTAVAEHMTTHDTATIKETLANIGELDAVKLDQERFKEDNPDEVTDDTGTLTKDVGGSTTAAPLAVRHEIKLAKYSTAQALLTDIGRLNMEECSLTCTKIATMDLSLSEKLLAI